MSRGKSASPLEAERIKILYADGVSENAIAKKLKRSRALVRTVIETHTGEIGTYREAIAMEKIDVYTDIISKGLDIIQEKFSNKNVVAGLTAPSIAKVVGILFDKRQLLIGKPTSIEDSHVTAETKSEASRLVEAFGEFATEYDSEGEEGHSEQEPVSVCPDIPSAYFESKDE
jgi:hypothetical protein